MEDIVYDKDRDGLPKGAAWIRYWDFMMPDISMNRERIWKDATYNYNLRSAYHKDDVHDCEYFAKYVWIGATGDVQNEPCKSKKRGLPCDCLMVSDYPDFESNARILENWKHFIYNSNLAHFICISTTYDLHNGSKRWLPWLDWTKKWSDTELREWFGITDSEWSLIESTCKKFRRDSEWFKRYMCGPSIGEVR